MTTVKFLWDAMWPNMFAPSLITLAWTGVLFLWHHFSLKKHITAEHEKSRAHISAVNGQPGKESLPSEEEVP